jgi:hypothetical protein
VGNMKVVPVSKVFQKDLLAGIFALANAILNVLMEKVITKNARNVNQRDQF